MAIAVNIELYFLPRHDRRHYHSIAAGNSRCEFGGLPVELEDGQTVTAIEGFENGDGHGRSLKRSCSGLQKTKIERPSGPA
jgi:hypothetical protein